MSKKGLNIYHRKDGRWEGRYKDGFRENGKPKYRSVYAKSYGEVRELLMNIHVSDNKPKASCALTVKQLFYEWLNAKILRVKESTVANYNFKIHKYLLSEFGSLKFHMLSPTLVYKFIQRMQSNGLSAKYISDMVVILKSMAKYASQTYHCENPIADVQLPKVTKSELNLYSKEQQAILKSELLKNITPTKIGILLCLFTGIRIGELCALQWRDIDFNNAVISINKTCQRIRCNGDTVTKLIVTEPKSSSSVRIIPLPIFLINILKEHLPSNLNYYLLSGTDKIIEPRTMQYRFKNILKKVNLPSTNFHSLRHIFATNCIELGFDVKTLSEILGHGTVEITLNRYVHSSMSRKRECMDKLILYAA